MTSIKIEKVSNIDNVFYIKKGDAAIDLRASGIFVVGLDDKKKEISRAAYKIRPNERILVKTGIKVQLPKGFWGNIKDRSGLALNHGIHQLGGVIDENYRGEIGVIIINLGKKPYTISKNDRIAQMVLTPYAQAEITYVGSLANSERGEKGFGNSGKK